MSTAVSGFTLAAAWAVAGLSFGLAYFAVLRVSVDLHYEASGRFVPAALTFARFAAAILFLGLAARFGALPLLTAFLGFLLARALALRITLRNA